MILATPKDIADGLHQLLEKYPLPAKPADFESDRLSKVQAAKLAGISIPTLDRQIKLGKFKQYSVGKRKYFLKSEMLIALRNE